MVNRSRSKLDGRSAGADLCPLRETHESAGHLLHLGFEAAVHLGWRNVLDVSRDRPNVAEWIGDAPAAVAIELVLHGPLLARTVLEGQREAGIHVRQVQANADRRAAESGW